jgi:phosphoglucomutase
MLIDPARLEREYAQRKPDVSDPNQLVSFGTSGHRGSPLNGSFTEAHILAITQAICEYRRGQGTDGPLYMGKDTHAVSRPAEQTALEVLAANGSRPSSSATMGHADARHLARDPGVQPRPQGASRDGIVITPSHNPPADGGFKYDPPNGGPADTEVTEWIERRANELLRAGNAGVKRVPFANATKAATTHRKTSCCRTWRTSRTSWT